MEIVIILAVVIGIAIAGAITGNKKVKEIPMPEEPKAESKLVLSNDFYMDAPTSKKENDHMITTLYFYKPDRGIWVCPNCEVENSSTKKQCDMCQYTVH